MAEPFDLELDGWHLKVRVPEAPGPHPVIFLNHGWTGDERSMWVFAAQMPKDALLVVPRALYPSTSDVHGGYSWVENRTDGWSAYADFAPAKAAFVALLARLPQELDSDFSRFALVGFSQGAAFNYALALEHPQRVERLAALAGFAPDGSLDVAQAAPLANVPVFIAHGAQDDTVPIDRAHTAAEIMQLAGANVHYCESDVGHKLGANCFSELRSFFQTTF